MKKLNEISKYRLLRKTHYFILVITSFLAIKIFAQQPLGKTKNARINSQGKWEIVSTDGMDGSKSGSLFIDNYPYVKLNPNESYWVAGDLIMYKGAQYQEDNIKLNFTECGGFQDFVHPNDSMLNKMSQASMFFQIFHGDLAGFQRVGTDDARYRIFFHTLGKGNVWHRNQSESLKYILSENDEVRFVMAFVANGDSINDPNIKKEYKSGSFIYYQIRDSLGNVKAQGFPQSAKYLL